VGYPMFKECALFYIDFLKKDARGRYDIWPASNPEAGEGSYEAWGRNPSGDISFIKMLLEATITSCRVLGCDDELRERCQKIIDHLPPYPARNGALIEMESKEFLYYQRHNGMLAGIFPCDAPKISTKLATKSVDRL